MSSAAWDADDMGSAASGGDAMDTPAWTPPPTMPPPATAPPAPVPAGRGVLGPERSAILRGDDGEQMTITVVDVANPAPTRDPYGRSALEISPRIGFRMVQVDLVVENTGGVPFIDDVEKYGWLVDRAGRTYARDKRMTGVRQLHPASRLDPGSLNGRSIVFEVKGSVDVTRFRLSTHPGVVGQTQDWRFS